LLNLYNNRWMMKAEYIKDENGNITGVVLPIGEYEKMIAELDEAADVHLYDQAKKEDDGNRILFSDYLKSRKVNV
jgi:hypothetical protein